MRTQSVDVCSYCFTLLLACTHSTYATASSEKLDDTPRRVFATSRFSVNQILTRPYDPDVPMGCVGDRVWASSPQGWAFRDDVHWLYLTNLKAFDLEVRDQHGFLQPAKATYYPSHVHMEGAVRSISTTASFTFATDNVQNPITKPFRPEKRWTCWSSMSREDWYAIDFGAKRQMKALKVWFFDDAPNGGCRPPDRVTIQYWVDGKGWENVESATGSPESPVKGENILRFDPVHTDRVRLLLRNAGDSFYTGIYGIELMEENDTPANTQPPDTSLEISADKFITADDILVCVMRIKNTSAEPCTIHVLPILDWTWTGEVELQRHYGTDADRAESGERGSLRSLTFHANARLHDQDVRRFFRFAVETDPATPVKDSGSNLISGNATIKPFPEYLRMGAGYPVGVPPNATRIFKAALELRVPGELSSLDRIFSQESESLPLSELSAAKQDLIGKQTDQYQSWFDRNIAYFDCSDEWLRKTYYHRAYVLRKNSLDPKLGRMQWKTQSEGRWRSGWYPNVISYGGGHQVREARWLRDPGYAQGHLRTFAENEKADGVYPSHVKPAGPQSGQYTDWITSAAWDAHLVHPDRQFLETIADKLAENVRGWQKTYDPDGDGLLLVDSHWWTGMEYQPSFFFFSNYKPAKNFHEPEDKVSLDRVDLTAYNFGNAQAMSQIYRQIGRPDTSAEFEALAKKIANAVAAKMWDSDEQFFYSLRHDDGAKADVKEVIGVYPFYFGMLPPGAPQHYEGAWSSIIDPDQFWTPWPVASVSKQCPAYSQTHWPGDGRTAGCMWNGPTWPHANSIVLSAMARTLRSSQAQQNAGAATADSRSKKPQLTREHFWHLFDTFTKAQFRDQDATYPWTGEFYHGETARWKTAERDYNHSTWLDVLIPDVLGLVPRADDVLEIDPLVPAGKLQHFLLDGQHYRGHLVTLVWDAPGQEDRYGDGRAGFDIYLDGKRVASEPALTRIMVEMKTGQRMN
jgi:hypothetical protein